MEMNRMPVNGGEGEVRAAAGKDSVARERNGRRCGKGEYTQRKRKKKGRKIGCRQNEKKG